MREAVKIRTKKRFAGAMTTAFSAYAAFCALVFPARTAESVVAALRLSVYAVVPTLVVFVTAYRILAPALMTAFAKMKRLQRFFVVSPGGLCRIAAGLLSGFPTGSVMYAALKKSGNISEKEGESLMPFCNNAGAAFLIGSVGTKMFGYAPYGVALFAFQAVSALIMILLTRRERRGVCEAHTIKREAITPSSAAKAIADGGVTMLGVTSFVAFFSVIGDALSSDLKLGGYVGALLRCVLEISGGMNALSRLGALGAATGGFAVGFSGISVYMQCHFAAGGEGMRKYFFGKLATSAVCGALTAAFCAFGEKAAFFEMFGDASAGAKNAVLILGSAAIFTLGALAVAATAVKIAEKIKKSEKLQKMSGKKRRNDI